MHRSVAQWLNVALTDKAFWFHPPNGGSRSKAEAGAFKAMGVKAGVPDIIVIYGGVVHAIELKPKGRYPSKAQRDCHLELVNSGARVLPIARSIDDVGAFLRMYMPLRVT